MYEIEILIVEFVIKKMVVIGSIVFREEVFIKFNIFGIIDEIFVEVGDIIKIGDLIVKVKVVFNVNLLISVKNNINVVRI